MKLTIVLLTAAFLQIQAAGVSQNVSVSKEHISLKEIFVLVKAQTGYGVFCKKELLEKTKPFSISVKDVPLADFLDIILKDQPLEYQFGVKTIFITAKNTPLLSTSTVTKEAELFSSYFIKIGGTIKDVSGQPLAGATIQVKGKKISAITNDAGVFELNAVAGDVLVISSVGFEKQEIKVTGLTEYQIVLKLRQDVLDTTQIIASTGYQNIYKERATGSFAQPNKQMYDARVSPDIISRLEGITSGLVFNRGTIADNAGEIDLSIRGKSTINANDQPLIVVDNFPYTGNINNLNPNDIASITVLKDAAAASIWGVNSGNGVIVIVTHKGRSSGGGPKVSFNANVTAAQKPDLFYNPAYLSASSYIDIETFLFDNGKYEGPLIDFTTYPAVSRVVQLLNKRKLDPTTHDEVEAQLNALRQNDVRDEELKYFYRKPITQQYSLSVSGGNEKANYYFSSGFDKALSNLKENENDRITLNSQLSFKPIKNLELTGGLYYIKARSTSGNNLASVKNSVSYNPYLTLADQQGNPLVMNRDISEEYRLLAASKGFLDWSYVPLNELGAAPSKRNTNEIRINTGIKYTLFRGLNAEVKYQYQETIGQGRTYKSVETYDVRSMINRYATLTNGKVSKYNIPLGGVMYTSDNNSVANNVRAQLNFDRSWNDHSISAIAGYEVGETVREGNSNVIYGYDDELGTTGTVDAVSTFALNPAGSGTISKGEGFTGNLERNKSTFFNAAYTYKQTYTLSGSARIDGSNYFGVKANQRNVPLWSAGLRWNINREAFYKAEWVPLLNARLSYGYNGNLDRMNTGMVTFKYNALGATWTNLPMAGIISIGNPELGWEKIGITNIGIDFGLRDQVISGSIEYYWKHGVDLLGDKPFAPSTGATALRGNYSNMKAKGLDLQLNSKNISGKLNWNSTLLFSYTSDRVTVYEVVDPYIASYVGNQNVNPVVNKPVHGIYSLKWAGLDPATGNPRGYLDGEVSGDHSAIINNTTFDDLIFNGTARPKVFGGLNNRLTYKNFTLSANISYKLAYYFRRPTISYNSLYNSTLTSAMHKDFEQRWQVSGDEKHTTVPSMGPYPGSGYRDQFYAATSATVEKGDHIRLQDVSVSFDLNKSNWKKTPFSNIQLYMYVNNLGIIWRANDKGLDPDNFTLPNPRSISFGIKSTL